MDVVQQLRKWLAIKVPDALEFREHSLSNLLT